MNASPAGTSATDLLEATDLGRLADGRLGAALGVRACAPVARAGTGLFGRGTVKVGDPPPLNRPGGEGERVDRDGVQLAGGIWSIIGIA